MICTRTLKDSYKSFKRFIEKVRTRDCQSTYKRLRKYVERVEKVAFMCCKQGKLFKLHSMLFRDYTLLL